MLIINYIYLIISIILIGLFLNTIESHVNERILYCFGNIGIYISSIIGTPIHELGHLIFCLLFFHNVPNFRLIPDKNYKETLTLGYVKHSYNHKNLYQIIGNFFIGIGPLIFGPLIILILYKILLPNDFQQIIELIKNCNINDIGNIFISFLMNIFKPTNWVNPCFYIFLYLALNISLHLGLSVNDIKNAFNGFIYLSIFVVLLQLIVFIFNINIGFVTTISLVFIYMLELILILDIVSYIIISIITRILVNFN